MATFNPIADILRKAHWPRFAGYLAFVTAVPATRSFPSISVSWTSPKNLMTLMMVAAVLPAFDLRTVSIELTDSKSPQH
jgi:hypothetical protein